MIYKQELIFGPVFGVILLTFVVWIYMYAKRIPFILKSGMTRVQLKTPGELARRSPPSVTNPSDNLKNLFEVPVLFYTLSLYLFVTNKVDSWYVFAGWVFFISRVLHSFIHCTVNIVIFRFYVYLISCGAVGYMFARAATAYFMA